MSLTITVLDENDNLAKSMVDINNNFDNVKTEVELIEAMVNPSSGNITANGSVTVSKGARSVSTEIFTNEASERIKGDLYVEGTFNASNVYLSNVPKITMSNGNITQNGSSSTASFGGDVYFDGNFVMKDYGDTAVVASNTGSYTTNSSNIGTLNVNGKNAIILDFSNYSSSANVLNTQTIQDFKLNTGLYQGQCLEMVVKAASSNGKPHYLLSNNISSLETTQKIELQEDYSVINLRYFGNAWIINSMFKCNIV